MKAALRWIAIIVIGGPLAWFGGNLAFGFLFDGTWFFYALAALNLNVAIFAGVVSLWIVRLVVFVLIVAEFRPKIARDRDGAAAMR